MWRPRARCSHVRTQGKSLPGRCGEASENVDSAKTFPTENGQWNSLGVSLSGDDDCVRGAPGSNGPERGMSGSKLCPCVGPVQAGMACSAAVWPQLQRILREQEPRRVSDYVQHSEQRRMLRCVFGGMVSRQVAEEALSGDNPRRRCWRDACAPDTPVQASAHPASRGDTRTQEWPGRAIRPGKSCKSERY